MCEEKLFVKIFLHQKADYSMDRGKVLPEHNQRSESESWKLAENSWELEELKNAEEA